MYQRFALDSNFICPPSWNSRKTIERKLIRIYSNCHVNFKCAANSFCRDLNSRYYTFSVYVNCLFSTCCHLKLRYYGVTNFNIYLWSRCKFIAPLSMALWTLYCNFKACYTYFTIILHLNFITIVLLKCVVFLLKLALKCKIWFYIALFKISIAFEISMTILINPY
jgi:hypothetical protein